ncbi:MAG: fasciclin domain-containing protein [Antricoccus sp.]
MTRHRPVPWHARIRAVVAFVGIALLALSAGCSSSNSSSKVASLSSSSAPPEPVSGDGCAADAGDGSAIAAIATKTLSAALAAIPSASDFAAYLKANTQTASALDMATRYAIFVPINAAFAKLTPAQKATIDTVPATRDAMLLYAVSAVPLVPSKLVAAQQVPTIYGPSPKLTVTISGTTMMLNGQATALCRNIATSGGTIYLTDTVLFPTA